MTNRRDVATRGARSGMQGEIMGKSLTKDRIRWGVMGPGGIARQFTKELKTSTNAEVYAVGSRSINRANAFAETFEIPKAYGSYDELVSDPDVDIIYVATPHPQHRENALLCIEAGKAVLCEKPFAVNARETSEIVNAAREKKVFLMEAMWTRYLPTIKQVRRWINGGAIGEVKLLNVAFGFKAPWNPDWRMLNKELGGGAVLDAGIYTTSFASYVFGAQPSRIESIARIGSTDVDEWFSALFDYGDDRMALISNAIRLPLRTEAVIHGTDGRIDVPSFLSAKSATLHHVGRTEESFTDHAPGRGMIHEAEEAMRCLREGLLESPVMKVDETVAIMKTLDAVRKPWGLVFPADTEQ